MLLLLALLLLLLLLPSLQPLDHAENKRALFCLARCHVWQNHSQVEVPKELVVPLNDLMTPDIKYCKPG